VNIPPNCVSRSPPTKSESILPVMFVCFSLVNRPKTIPAQSDPV
jgi:hypothetical protein